MHTHVTMHVYTLDMTYIIMISDFELAENVDERGCGTFFNFKF